MKVRVRLFATLREGRGKELELELAGGASPRKIAEILNLPPEDVSILLINGRDGGLDQPLNEGDLVSLFPPVGGG